MCLQGEGLPPFKWRRRAAEETETSNANISPEFLIFFRPPEAAAGWFDGGPTAAGASLSSGCAVESEGRRGGGASPVPAALGGLVIKTGDKETQRSRCNN